jgi:hypothetical protein
MRELSFRLRRNRYLFPVAILRPDSPTDLTSFAATALLDTGATVTGVGPRVIDTLGLESYGKKRLRSATDEVFVDYFLFRIGLFTTDQTVDPPTDRAAILPFVIDEFDGFSWRRQADFDVIIGMDVLSRCDVSLDRGGKGRIAFG